MARVCLVAASCVVVMLSVSSCGGVSTPSSSPTSTVPSSSTDRDLDVDDSAPGLTVAVAPSPAVVAVGVPVDVTVTARTTGILSVEDIQFGDGGSSGANAG